jgi:hypothetical protein
VTFAPISVQPGVVKSTSDYGASGRWIDMDHVRFVDGKPEKLRGTVQYFTTTFSGVARAAEAWSSYAGIPQLVWGTACALFIYQTGALSNITPYRLDSTAIALVNPFTLTEGSAVVSVADAAHGITAAGVIVNFSGATAFGGITISGAYTVTSIIDVNTYTITHSAPATAVNDSFTKVLLHMDGVDASTTFTDSNAGGAAHTWTARGNAQVDTADSQFGGASLLCDGTGDSIDTPDHADFTLGSGNFTIEMRFKINGGDGSTLDLAGQSDAGLTAAASAWYLQRISGTLRFGLSTGAAFVVMNSASTYNTTTNTGWHHVAVVRNGNNLFMYVDGVQQATVAFTGAVQDSAQVLNIGARSSAAGTWFGWIDEFRLSNTARWTAAFTPPLVAYSNIPGGGAVTASYTLNCGDVSATYLRGWGVGTWGGGTTGWGGLTSLALSPLSEPTNWSFGVYGEDLVINQLNNGIWIYDTSNGPTNRPVVLTNAPAQVRSIIVTQERYIFALGCTIAAGTFDPMTVRWPDLNDPTAWTVTTTNTANERKLQGGTRLIAGTAVSSGLALVWSDSHAFVFQYTGARSVIYSSRAVGRDCGLIAQQAKAVAKGVAYWMSENNFFLFNGAVQEVPNQDDIRSWVFANINRQHQLKSFAFYNSDYNEIWFVWPDLASSEPSRYVAVNLDDNSWIHGTWDRSAAARYTSGESRPVMFGSTDGKVYLHDADSSDNNGVALASHLELAPTDVQDGNLAVDIFGFVPDFQRQDGNISFYVYGLDHPRDGIVMQDTVTVEPTDKIADLKSAGRQFGLILSTTDLGCDWAMGKWGLELGEAAAQQRNST